MNPSEAAPDERNPNRTEPVIASDVQPCDHLEMHIGRDSVVRYLRERGRHEEADRFQQSAPERIHAAQDAELLRRFGIDPSDVEGETFRDLPPRDD